MKITKYINFSQSVDIDISSDDISEIFDRDSSTLPYVLYGLNSIATFLKGVSDLKIAEMTPEQRKVIRDFLFSEGKRY